MDSFSKYILPADERYSILHLNEVKIISHGQTLAMVLGSCVSTVFVARDKGNYYLGANHIVIANPKIASGPMLSANYQIDTILEVFKKNYNIRSIDILSLHLIGGGAKNSNHQYSVHRDNQNISYNILEEKGFKLFFHDVGSYYTANYSIYKNNLAVFVENKFIKRHFSFIMDLNILFKKNSSYASLPASAINPRDKGFEELVSTNTIINITGERNR